MSGLSFDLFFEESPEGWDTEPREVKFPGKKPVHGRPHLLTLIEHDDGDWDLEVEHTDDCLDEYGEVACDVSIEEQNTGLGEFFVHVADAGPIDYSYSEVLVPGEYWITAWSEHYRGFDYEEWDGGLRLVYGRERQ